MKENKISNFKLIRKYLRDNLNILLSLLLVFVIMGVVFALYTLPVMAVIYSAFISILPLGLFGVMGFFKYRRRYIELVRLEDSIVQGISTIEPQGTSIERQLTEIISHMARDRGKILTKSSLKQNEQLDYYTMWVHQIKTPISAMRLLLQSEKSELNRELSLELFKIEQYVDMVLGYLRLDSMNSDLKLEEYEIHEIVKNAIKKHRSAFIHEKITLELEDFSNRVITDEKWLMFVIEQIISNSLKYTKKGKLRIYMDDYDNLYIADTGIGISPEDLPRIFERGFTGYNGRINKTSTGLGLYLCRRIMENLGHTININSQPEEGTLVKLGLKREKFVPY